MQVVALVGSSEKLGKLLRMEKNPRPFWKAFIADFEFFFARSFDVRRQKSDEFY